MQKKITLRLLPAEAADPKALTALIAASAAISPAQVSGFYITKQSIDARGKQAWINISLEAFINEPFCKRPQQTVSFAPLAAAAPRVVIIGAGPAGLFAALRLIECGIKPIVLERGKEVRARRRDLARLNKEGLVNEDSNYCFGEGGAGTYSDGKLYTRSNKRGDVDRILQLFVQFGADENILYRSHPHIGTNKLPGIITAMREQILQCGGEILFEQRVSELVIKEGQLKAVKTHRGDQFEGAAFLLATGHSARDIFYLLHQHHILIEAKPFALGVRVEHPQALVDQAQYHCEKRSEWLPPAAYSWVQQVQDKGVFSFCMCPGGIIAPAATAPGELVVNGWSPSKRNNPYANSGIVVAVDQSDLSEADAADPLSLLRFQQQVEQKAFIAGGGALVAPALRLTDFCEGKLSATLPDCSYLPGLRAAPMQEVLPDFVLTRLQAAFREQGKKMKGYYSQEAVVVATESRTSSPVRIPRDPATLSHPQLKELFPCGEGAGYAGGIVSAAMDGERVALAIAATISARH
ncbi:MAG: FAD-binding protein [Chitinophagia bacterium]|nr:FAD-binding protein [Chitinophagia bacterium]